MKFASGGGGSSWSTADSDGLLSNGASTGNFAPTNTNESYDGSSWTTQTNTPQAKTMANSGGNNTYSLGMGGDTNSGGNWGTSPQTTSHSWNGSSWTTENSLPTAINQSMGGWGSATAIIFTGTYSAITANQTWNGSSWSGATAYPSGVRGGAGDGSDTAAIGSGGYNNSSYLVGSNTWDGTSWSSIANMPSGVSSEDEGFCGTPDNFIRTFPPDDTAVIYVFDGTSWGNTASTSNYGKRGRFGGDSTNCFKNGNDTTTFYGTEMYDGSSWSTTNNASYIHRSPVGSGANT